MPRYDVQATTVRTYVAEVEAPSEEAIEAWLDGDCVDDFDAGEEEGWELSAGPTESLSPGERPLVIDKDGKVIQAQPRLRCEVAVGYDDGVWDEHVVVIDHVACDDGIEDKAGAAATASLEGEGCTGIVFAHLTSYRIFTDEEEKNRG
mgnify:CR=1 FL=1